MEADDIIIIEHPMMMERHVIAKIIKVTNSMVEVLYWVNHRKEWGDETKRRKKETVTKILGKSKDFQDRRLQILSDQLSSANNELREKRQKAQIAYYAKVKAL